MPAPSRPVEPGTDSRSEGCCLNYYEKHIGDYIKDTLGLSMLEDGAYNRLLDQQYNTERPLPADKDEMYRLARASAPAERKAVDYVLNKFFTLTDTGYIHERAQAQIEAYWDREPAEQNKRDSAKVRQQRSRERRKALFDLLREHGVTPPFNASMAHLESEMSRVTSRDNKGDSNAPVTRDDTLTQSPPPNTQSPKEVNHPPDDSTEVGAAQQPQGSPSRIGEICILLRGLGVHTSPQALTQHTWPPDPGATDELLRTAVAEAKESNPTGRVHVNYLKPIIERLLNPPEAKPPKPKSDDWEWKRSDGGIERKGREMGMFARGGESHRDFAGRIDDEIRKRKGSGK